MKIFNLRNVETVGIHVNLAKPIKAEYNPLAGLRIISIRFRNCLEGFTESVNKTNGSMRKFWAEYNKFFLDNRK